MRPLSRLGTDRTLPAGRETSDRGAEVKSFGFVSGASQSGYLGQAADTFMVEGVEPGYEMTNASIGVRAHAGGNLFDRAGQKLR